MQCIFGFTIFILQLELRSFPESEQHDPSIPPNAADGETSSCGSQIEQEMDVPETWKPEPTYHPHHAKLQVLPMLSSNHMVYYHTPVRASDWRISVYASSFLDMDQIKIKDIITLLLPWIDQSALYISVLRIQVYMKWIFIW